MRWGCCGSVDMAAAIKDAGFDFLEVGVQGVLRGDVDDATWAAEAPNVDRLGLPIEAANSLVPGKLPVIGPDRDLGTLSQYLARVAERARRLGIERIVFGSGGARRRPETVDITTADHHLRDFCKLAADACAKHDIVLVIEHLHKGETNTLNHLAEARRLCDAVRHPALALLVDSYHYGIEKETDEAVLKLGDRLRHVHVAEPVDRIQPGGHLHTGKAKESFDFIHFFTLLHKIGYDERVSFEGKWFGEMKVAAPQCLAFMKDAWTAAAARNEIG